VFLYRGSAKVEMVGSEFQMHSEDWSDEGVVATGVEGAAEDAATRACLGK